MTLTYEAYREGRYFFPECFYAQTRGYLEESALEEKHQMALVMQRFAQGLNAQRYLLGAQDQPLHWLEPGCGNGATTTKYIRIMLPYHAPGFILHASDSMDESVEHARRAFDAMGAQVRTSELAVKDAFTASSLTQFPGSCDIAMASHMVYHAQMQVYQGKLPANEVACRMDHFMTLVMQGLKDDGLFVAFHETSQSDLSGKLGRDFGSAMPDAAEQLEASAARLGYAPASLSLYPKLHFPVLSNQVLRDLENVNNWRDFGPQSDEASWVKKFMFGIQNNPRTDADGNETGPGGALGLALDGRLPAAIRFTRDILDQNDGALVIRARMHAIPKNPDRLPLLRGVFADIENAMPDINRQVQKTLSSYGAPAP